MILSLTELRLLALAVGFPDPDTAAAVAMAESGGNPSAYGDAEYGGSVGLWQVNLPSHPQYDALALEDPWYNARAALAISRGGATWQPWTTYREGLYRPYMPAVPTVVLVVGGVAAVAGAGWLLWRQAQRPGGLGKFAPGRLLASMDRNLAAVGL